MARHKTKKQKMKSAQKVQVVSTQTVPQQIPVQPETQTTFFSQSQVKLVTRDLLKTLLVTIVVFTVLLSIIVFMR